ncbi:hypothetical protein Ddye_009389 [Dipteronia dyeriana]|uniref:Uncharacterized protein n=1 Tax=Dipteronia dyeriana TaxID=168575 RepID=A0AAE0CM74_9ROSI|nr:hypothetical protein Ddye_009389 [Dipteronia dyeriana]
MSTKETTSAPSSSINEKGLKKNKGRGLNKVDLNKFAKAKEDGIRFNNLRQPIGKTSIPLSTTYGVVATQLVTYESWPYVPDVLKDSLWETTKTRFGLDETGKSHKLSLMGLSDNTKFNVGGATVEGRTHTSSLHHQSQAAASTSQIGDSQQKSNKCKLLHWIGSGEVVVEGEIDCTGPTTSIHHMILGPYC